jgi:16S rRNA (guanine(527)-N(7))-methyltransferase RsmG
MINKYEKKIRVSLDKIVEHINGYYKLSPVGDIYDKFVGYVDCVNEWRESHNIISKKYEDNDIWENICDSINLVFLLTPEILSQLKNGEKIVDAGAGGGFPGIPLAIVFTENNVCLVDSNRKKCSFLRSTKAKLNLRNITVAHERIEKMSPAAFMVTKAAFSPPRVEILANAIKKDGRIVIWTTMGASDEFIHAFKRFKVLPAAKYDYMLFNQKKRRLLLLTKT